MNSKILILILIASVFFSCKDQVADTTIPKQAGNLNIEKDLLLAHFDCKTDVDDLHSVAAFSTLLSHPKFSKIKYHAVAGTYGTQEGLYVPANDLFQLAFGDHWTDAHENFEAAIEQIKPIVKSTLSSGGDLWIAEAGQSDFSAALIKAIQIDLPEINIAQRFHVVQHSDWNEKSTSSEALQFVKQNADYHKIPDGNVLDNGSPGFRSPDYKDWKTKIKNPRLQEVWQLAVDLGVQYNGQEGRYDNPAVTSGGLDFSDLSETCWILGLQDIRDMEQFFTDYAN